MSLFKKDKTKLNLKTDTSIVTDERILNAASTLLMNIQFSSVDNPYRTIAVTSTAPNEGKSTVSLSLAAVIGRQGMKCLLVECDMRRRSLANALNIRTRPCMYDLLKGKVSLSQAVCATPLEGVSLLDAEHGIPHPDALIRSEAFQGLLEKLPEKFDYVILDTPPALGYPDASIASSLADATILVCQTGYTQKKAAVAAVEQLNNVGANLVGTVLNASEKRSYGGYDYYYDYSYEDKGSKKGEVSVPTAAPAVQPSFGQQPHVTGSAQAGYQHGGYSGLSATNAQQAQAARQQSQHQVPNRLQTQAQQQAQTRQQAAAQQAQRQGTMGRHGQPNGSASRKGR